MNSIAPITSLSETLIGLYEAPRKSVDDDISLRNNTVEAFETINSTAQGLLSFVESYRKFTAVPRPEVQLFALRPLIEKLVSLEKAAIDRAGAEIEIMSLNHDIMVKADEKLLFQVLVNLTKNALEACSPHHGKIQIRYGKHSDNKIYIEVANNGEPIPADVLPHIFIPFFTTKDNGSGIGLSVSRYIMRLHGGKLIHTYTADGWTVFKVIC
jgi:signal transduction histidine kinase